ncbi:MAG: hypothetical protein ACR2OH_13565, partial [Microthrixaceae bacterium]
MSEELAECEPVRAWSIPHRRGVSVKRIALAGTLLALLVAPASVAAQEDADASAAPIGVTTFDVCLAIAGPVIQLTPEALTEGITDGTFVIEGLS